MPKSLPKSLVFALLCLYSLAARADLRAARVALAQGALDEAAAQLHEYLGQNPHDALAHQSLCRVFYAEGLADKAITECEAAVTDSHADSALASDSEVWLGRAYGMKASHANPIVAFRIARKVVAAFDRAVELNPKNISALSDLGEYYVGAPAIVGGGLDKADDLATRILPISASKAHRLLALTAEKRGDNATAEGEFKKAFDVQRTPQTLIDLGDFYQRHKQCDLAVTTIKTLARMDRTRDAALVDSASVLVACDREPQLAIELLSSYLTSPARSDSAPAPRVHVHLGHLLEKTGDTSGAQHEYQAALALAADFAPARKALHEIP